MKKLGVFGYGEVQSIQAPKYLTNWCIYKFLINLVNNNNNNNLIVDPY